MVASRRLPLKRAGVGELAGVAMLFTLAVLLRWPYLWDIPRFSDELQEVLWSLSIADGEMLPLTAVDSYYGPLWSYLLAGLFVVFGPSPALPRLVAMLLGAGLVALTYCFTRDVAGRWPAAIAAGLLATSGGHIVISSHTSRSNSTTPLLVTAALWLLYRAIAGRGWDFGGGCGVARRPSPRLLVPAGLMLGLALQTHVSVIAFGPGVAAYVLWQARRLLRTPWPYLAVLAALIGYSNMIVYNLMNGFWSLRHAHALQEAYTGGRTTDPDFYLSNLGNLLQSLSRLLSGAIDSPESPSRFLYALLALLGLLLIARRGGVLLPLTFVSVVTVLPYFNPRYGPILSGRYLIPLLPMAFTAIGCVIVVGARTVAARYSALDRIGWKRLAAIAAVPVVLYPLAPLHSYYQHAVADGRTNEPLYTLVRAVLAARQPGESVVLDEGLAQESLGAGGTDLKAFRMLLGTSRIPYEIGKVGEIDDVPLAGGSELFLMEAKKRALLPRAVNSSPVSPEVASASGSGHRYAVYRITPR
jgi:4-amino-4-deoxy-L-arabinose transferase-like glycosyltransferase